MAQTKKVRINLSALTRVEYTEVLEVPADMSPSELEQLLDQRYDDVDGGEYFDDPDYWDRGDSCEVTVATGDDKAIGTVERDGGSFRVIKIPPQLT